MSKPKTVTAPETKMQKYQRIFEEWKRSRDKTENLRQQWVSLAGELRMEMDAKDGKS